MKKQKQPGENISLKTKKNESPAVIEWINAQANLMDSIRYLIENEIRLHGVRNLQLTIPSERTILEIAAAAEPLGGSNAATPLAPPPPLMLAEAQDEIDDEDIEAWI